jgi:glutamate racemase
MSKNYAPTIGVFDSGFGGLTVLRELLPLIGDAHCVFLGDTARLPYGSKSRETVVRYALSSARFLQQQGAQMLVIACNTATALALDDLREALTIPVVGVIEPGAEAAAGACKKAGSASEILVVATEATVGSHAYMRACAALGLKATEKACPLLVPLVEEGWIAEDDGSNAARADVTAQVLRIYLGEALDAAPASRALLLGCTHYPLLRSAIERTLTELGRPLVVVDSAQTTALAVARVLSEHGILHTDRTAVGEATCEFFATDSVAKFERLGSRFLGRPVERVQLVDLGG